MDKDPGDGGDRADAPIAPRDDVALPGEEDDDLEKGDQGAADVNWHNFESQYSMALAQSAIIEREKWGSNIEFLLSCISSAVGLGNIWRFPIVCGKNGGGAFLIPYMIVVFLIGRPLYYLELSLGQFSSRGSVKVWEMAPLFRGIGYGTGVASFMVSTFYVALMAWTLLYLLYSCYSPFPWQDKKEYANTAEFFEKYILKEVYDLNDPKNKSTNATHGHYDRLFKEGGGLGPPSWEQFVALLIAWIIIWMALVKGVSGSGKVAYFTALFPYLVLFILLGVGCSLQGSGDGILFFLTPQWEFILKPRTWFEAVNQCFFSLGVGFGGCVMFSSYNHFNHNLGRDVLIISIVDTFTSFLAGITVFSILGNLAFETKQSIKTIAEKGGGALAFISYPQAMNALHPYPLPQIVSFLFFFMLLTLGIGSATALAGTTITIMSDDYPNIKKWIVVSVNCILGLVGGIIYLCPAGSNVLDLVDTYGASFVIYIFALMEICGVVFVYGLKNFCNDLEFMLGKKVSMYWIICWSLLPFLLIVIFTFNIVTFQPDASWDISAKCAGWVLTALILIIPFAFGFRAVQTKRSSHWWKKFKASLYPTRRWGPKDPIIKEAWRRFRKTRPTRFAWVDKVRAKIGICSDKPPPTLSALQSQAPSNAPSESMIGYSQMETAGGSEQPMELEQVQSVPTVQSVRTVQSAELTAASQTIRENPTIASSQTIRENPTIAASQTIRQNPTRKRTSSGGGICVVV